MERVEQRRARRGFMSLPLYTMPSILGCKPGAQPNGQHLSINIWKTLLSAGRRRDRKQQMLVNWFSQVHQNEAFRLNKLISPSVTGTRLGSKSTDRNAHHRHPQEAYKLEKTSEPRHSLRSSMLCHGVLCTVGQSYKQNRIHRSSICKSLGGKAAHHGTETT